jgi:16S rRNA U516 pseudouridylate synthase RsuA-like enzyme
MKNDTVPQMDNALETLVENLSRIQYGEVSLTYRLHNGRIVSVTHTVTESTRQSIGAEMKNGPPGS